ncbi:hypothetical protein BJ508DRAFT_359277 [Ascobolus immersus RN42]|uniref:Uncharacterized protein n=1 Tax=Ascobolus immersus RN42 TaxID=1160509 RepID=A0A3N4IUE2_ASCIM|nr:hypothetical protein BJ508DRAFT_359277 [Ascobolus immersus RN42]
MASNDQQQASAALASTDFLTHLRRYHYYSDVTSTCILPLARIQARQIASGISAVQAQLEIEEEDLGRFRPQGDSTISARLMQMGYDGNGPDVARARVLDGQLAAPVAAPLAAPVAAPLAAPVAAPLAAPVAAPLAAPVAAPLAAPVAAPLAAPVAAPLAAPVVAPLAAPVAAPLAAPVVAPLAAPVAAPLAAPVVAPLAAPVAARETGPQRF